ncbi:MAG: serine/threonine protein phosphatase [Gammaproteobacteria bacterium]|nr:serine/threonine protein phosphatase [Gammaproteobacteria bacterium]
MATFAIGDIHGCLTALDSVLDSINLQYSDTLVFLGDYIDRGPDSRGVVDRVLRLREDFRTVTLRGNHEIMMMEAREDQEKLFMWQHFGGEQTLDSYRVDDGSLWQDCIPQEHWDFFESTARYYATATHIFVHAGLNRKKSLEQQDDAGLFWKKYRKPARYDDIHTVICGHTARELGEIADYDHTVCIDTYAYGGQWLTCLNTDTGEYWQANQEGARRSGSRNC